MRRIDTSTAVADLFGPGKNGFGDGNPALAILATRLNAAFFNSLQEELANAIEQGGLALDPGDNSQLSILIEGLVDRKAPVASQGEAVEAVEANANNVKRMTPLRVLQAIKANLGLPAGYLSGFELSNNVASPTNTLDVAAGAARSASDLADIRLTASVRAILQSAGGWVAGDNQNKLDTGVRSNNTWYHVFVIRKASDGSADILFSLSATAPAMPGGYVGFKRIGSVRTDGAGNIRAFSMLVQPSGRRVVSWSTPILDVNQVSLGTAAVLYTLSVPSGVSVVSLLNTYTYANNSFVYFSDPATADLAPANGAGYSGFTCGYGMVTDAAMDSLGSQLAIITNTSSQIRARANLSGNTVSVLTLGWEE